MKSKKLFDKLDFITYGFVAKDKKSRKNSGNWAQRGDYLSEQYSGLLSFSQPEKTTWVTYNFNGDQERYYQIYDRTGDLTEQILSYNFGSVYFSPNEDGKLWIIKINNFFLSTEKIGDYPIKTLEEAQEQLLNGEYITSYSKEYLKDNTIEQEHIVSAELIYHVNADSEVFMPYYLFYVKLPLDEGVDTCKGYKNYEHFYVPALGHEYLVDFPV